MAKKKKKLTITMMDRLKMAKKVMRDTTHPVKPMVTKNKKKEANKNASRKYRQEKNK
ncbi:MAG: hypothetical protein HC836_37325 [Richelia sp. RM2_1_2]|nr:hypothetical protein [Richelia sp. RM2_1_2]